MESRFKKNPKRHENSRRLLEKWKRTRSMGELVRANQREDLMGLRAGVVNRE
jgi:hypothetical protein